MINPGKEWSMVVDQIFNKVLRKMVILEQRLNVIAILDIIEPRHEISNNVVCATSKASDQPAYTRSLIRAFACRLNIL